MTFRNESHLHAGDLYLKLVERLSLQLRITFYSR